MKILVVGGNGYVGSKLCPALVERGHDITICDLNWFGDHTPPRVTLWEKDARTLSVDNLVGFDQVIFLAGFSNDPMAEMSPWLNFQYNAALPAYLCYQSKKALVRRFIYASSCSVYGFAADKVYTEKDDLHCSYPYGISKLQGEVGCLEQADKDYSVIALRKGTISGYAKRMRFDLVINAMVKSANCEGIIRVHNPSLWRPILGIDDAVSAYIRAVEAPMSISGSFNVASLNATIGEIADQVKSTLSDLAIPCKLEIQSKEDMRNYQVSTNKAIEKLGFFPKQKIYDIALQVGKAKKVLSDATNELYYNSKICSKIVEK